MPTRDAASILHVERDVPRRGVRGGGEVLGQHVLAGWPCRPPAAGFRRRGRARSHTLLCRRRRKAGEGMRGAGPPPAGGRYVFFHSAQQVGVVPLRSRSIRTDVSDIHDISLRLAVPNRNLPYYSTTRAVCVGLLGKKRQRSRENKGEAISNKLLVDVADFTFKEKSQAA